MRESLVDKDVIVSTHAEREIAMLPYINIIALGGRSILDKGKAAVFPLVAEIVRNRKKHHMIIGVGGGTRARHTYHIALDLGLPIGGMAMIAGGVEEQNQKMIQSLLAPYSGITVSKDHFLDLPLFVRNGMIPVIVGMPPYHYWEPPPEMGHVPMNGPDTGLFKVSEVLGARSMIFVKDVDGLFTEDPKRNPRARLIPRVSVEKLMEMDLEDLPIERAVLQALLTARHMTRIRVINGLVPGSLTRALEGRPVGTLIYREHTSAPG